MANQLPSRFSIYCAQLVYLSVDVSCYEILGGLVQDHAGNMSLHLCNARVETSRLSSVSINEADIPASGDYEHLVVIRVMHIH